MFVLFFLFIEPMSEEPEDTWVGDHFTLLSAPLSFVTTVDLQRDTSPSAGHCVFKLKITVSYAVVSTAREICKAPS